VALAQAGPLSATTGAEKSSRSSRQLAQLVDWVIGRLHLVISQMSDWLVITQQSPNRVISIDQSPITKCNRQFTHSLNHAITTRPCLPP
jgi:hypothetical protein